jgi:hypothetical protein
MDELLMLRQAQQAVGVSTPGHTLSFLGSHHISPHYLITTVHT